LAESAGPHAKPDQPAQGKSGAKPEAKSGATPAANLAAPAKPQAAKPPPPEQKDQKFKPAARPARMRRRHFGLILSFLIMVVAPFFVTVYYLYTFAQDQFAASAGFTVRSDEGSAATDIMGGLAQFTGTNTRADGDILFEFITSAELVGRMNQRIDLRAHYAAPHGIDPIFALAPDAAFEDLVSHWQDVVRVSYGQSSGLIDLQVLAFDPVTAHTIAAAIVAESQSLINELNAQARADAMRFAEIDLEAAITRLRLAREALTQFRTETQIVDPESDLQGRNGVLNNLQQQLAEALIEFDLLSENTTNSNDPRLVQAQRRIEVIRDRISQERQNFATGDIGRDGQDYPTLIARYEGLIVDREFAESSYRAALTALDAARTNAARQSRYLAVYIRPTIPESAEFPRRDVIAGMALLFLMLGWATAALIYYSIRDRQ
jgi:capsular polysaccharide transport system permease protein